MMNEQISMFLFMKTPPRFNEAEWLRAHGFKNIYDERPPIPGMYEWKDIEHPDKSKILEYTGNGCIHLGKLAMGKFRPIWWRPIKEK